MIETETFLVERPDSMKATPMIGATPPMIGATPDLFTLGRSALLRVQQLHDGRGVFARSRQLLNTGAWKGPRDAADSFVEDEDLLALGGISAAQQVGVRTLVVTLDKLDLALPCEGLRLLCRFPYRHDDDAKRRDARIHSLATFMKSGLALDGLIPTPAGEPQGIDTLMLFARLRTDLQIPHVIADFTRLGHRLAQMALGFGADELHGPIQPERALRLGSNTWNPVMTRKEAAMLLRGAGLRPHERLSGGALEEVTS